MPPKRPTPPKAAPAKATKPSKAPAQQKPPAQPKPPAQSKPAKGQQVGGGYYQPPPGKVVKQQGKYESLSDIGFQNLTFTFKNPPAGKVARRNRVAAVLVVSVAWLHFYAAAVEMAMKDVAGASAVDAVALDVAAMDAVVMDAAATMMPMGTTTEYLHVL
ncbi:hypothetical protein FRC01_000607 [Tulasnella sp. 417]|nr:hypothetical protein FRC01_000607 [Tulasnella sp. 417]